MLKISPLLIYNCCNKLTTISQSILENYDLLCSKSWNLYDKVRQYFNIDDFESIYYELDFQIQIWRKLLVEIETALGEPIEKIMEADYKEEYIEKKLFDYYVSLSNDNNENNNYKRYLLNEICDFGLTDENYDKNVKIALLKSKMFEDELEGIIKSVEGFNYKNYGYLSIDDVVDDLVLVWDRERIKSQSIMDCVKVLSEKNINYEFNPTSPTKSDAYYSCRRRMEYPYTINSEIININGYEFDFAQVLPEDYTKIEKIYYDYYKSEIINTMKTLPDNYLKAASSGNSNAIVLTSSHNFMHDNDADWGGYYMYSSIEDENVIVINTPVTPLGSEKYYTKDVIIHEMGHKFDDYSNGFDEPSYYTYTNNIWDEYYEKYQDVLPPIVAGGYDPIPDTQEFFAETASAYFINPDELKELCPEVYDAFHEMLGYEN